MVLLLGEAMNKNYSWDETLFFLNLVQIQTAYYLEFE